MKKITVMFTAFLLAAVISVSSAEAAYLPEHDQYVEVTFEQARFIADLVGLKDVELGEETARISFEVQEAIIAKIEKLLNTEIDHFYIWLTVNGEPVIGIDPPFALY
ncbi:8-amino-7-oxononanoate synthase [Bacillus mesophilum]|uniref:8-amino-7-oxononanoate synthase n=1 Tax=Bacillus mesophilum TaxID=1071718 RepID=A0A7V7RMD6_9BACI|nr:8-amino-7-oxononanoate synthase [Bacillus mesophilum]KAB2333455.1 8-amino-7-oxononanoate synthase [Bacillus mesophilum]